MPYHQYGFKLLKLGLLVIALIETFTGSVIECIVYTTDDNSSTSILQYFIGAYYLPNKHIYKFIVVLYVPALCLWRVRRRTNAVNDANVVGVDGCNEVQSYRLKPAALVCQQIFHVVLYFGNAPGIAVSQAFYSQRLRTWLRWLFTFWFRWIPWTVSKQHMNSFYFNDEEPNGDKLNSGVETLPDGEFRPACEQLCPGDELVLPSEIWNSRAETDEELLTSIDQSPDKCHQQSLKEHNSALSLIRLLPLNLVSRLYGRIHRCNLPVWLRVIVLQVYIWLFDCNLDEVQVQDLREYHNLSEFFRRSLREGVRPIDECCDLTSPADGTIVYCGEVVKDYLEQVKGVTYSLSGFLGPRTKLFDISDVQNQSLVKTVVDQNDLIRNPDHCLFQCVIYLAPGDYHHFHSPADWTVSGRRHFPGELCSVSPIISQWVPGLFNVNERALYVGQWQYGFFSMTAVGATLVGSINVYFDETLSTNRAYSGPSSFYDEFFQQSQTSPSGVSLCKGEAMGDFRLGSTIVLLFEAPFDFKLSVIPGQRVKYGCGLSTVMNDR